jgi:hypothetical protein
VAEIINLRRARKARTRAEKDKTAKASRAAHGIAKSAKKLAKVRIEKAGQRLSEHRLDPDK